MKSLLVTVLLIGLACFEPESDTFYVVTNGHAHNDYEHDRPLMEALEAGFISVEADVHLIKDSLFVVHDAPESTAGIPTLTSLYLEPLAQWIKDHDGKVYPGYDGFFYLMIDLKTDGELTYQAIRKELMRYKEIISIAGESGAKPVKVFISGNRPIEMLLGDSIKIAAIDGRPENIGEGFSTALMPVISQSYGRYLSWRGEGKPDSSEIRKTREMIEAAHAESKLVRLWSAPDTPEVWSFLLELGVDWINTDHLEEFRSFSLEKQ